MRSTGTSALTLPATLVLGAAWLVLACTLAGPTTAPASTQATARPGPTAVSPTAAPTKTAAASPTAAPLPSPTASPAASPAASEYLGQEPPVAVLSTAEGPVYGWLGTYCWMGTCADAFELPPKAELPEQAIQVIDGRISVSLSPTVGFVRWSASFGESSMQSLTGLDSGGSAYDPDSNATPPPEFLEATFDPPPAGDWVLYVQITFFDGDAAYAWHVTVT